MRSIWYGKLIAKIDEKRKDTTSFLLDGGCNEASLRSSYGYNTGYLAGLNEALLCAAEVDDEMIGARPGVPRNSPPDH